MPSESLPCLPAGPASLLFPTKYKYARHCWFSSAGFSLWGFVLPGTKPRKLKHALLPCQIKIADFVVWRGAIPHAPLRIAEEFAHDDFGMRKWILDHIPRSRIEAAKRVCIVGVIPKITVRIEPHRVWAGTRAGQGKFLKCLRLR